MIAPSAYTETKCQFSWENAYTIGCDFHTFLKKFYCQITAVSLKILVQNNLLIIVCYQRIIFDEIMVWPSIPLTTY